MELIHERKFRRDNNRVAIGLILIALAGFIFADNFDLLPWHLEHYVLSWPSVLILIGFIILVRNESKTTGIILVSVGAFFLAAKIIYPFGIRHLFWPTVLAIIGVLLIVRQKNHRLFSGRDK
ncbi:MAG: hypothetical protein EHM93_00160 [Bacteroidales bacterium]|nr:MAG: hypothetical protein EHM93_00160 [Bacteroidales bacterium]